MLGAKASGWQTRPDISRQLLNAFSWRIARSGGCPSAATFYGKSRLLLTRNHDTRAYTSTARRLQTACGIVTTDAPSQTTIEQLLAPLKDARPGAISKDARSSGATAQLTLLLTPSYAHHALDHELPRKAWDCLPEAIKTATTLETVVAVVDKMPVVLPPQVRLIFQNFGDAQEGIQEGLAYLITRPQKVETNTVEAATTSEDDLIPPLRGKPGTLRFRLPTSHTGGGIAPAITEQILELPLAQTIFSTGMVSTLVKTSYTQDDQLRLRMQTQVQPRSVQLDLPEVSQGVHTFLRLPLQPLTPARQVKYSMGNILRQLWHGETAHTASEELEQAVSSYFDALGMRPEAVTVWALIIPVAVHSSVQRSTRAGRLLDKLSAPQIQKDWASTREFQSIQYGLQSSINLGVLDLLHQGAKLCRVLSGGGGWGKKAGLLSLDPDNSYGPIEQGNIQHNPRPAFGVEPMHEDTPSAFGQIAEVGDSVLFFLAPYSLDAVKPEDGNRPVSDCKDQDLNETVPSPTYCFGALPSSIDDVIPAAADVLSKSKITHIPDTFGMFSEGGMALASSIVPKSSESPTWTKTKLDVPLTRLIVEPFKDFPKHAPQGQINNENKAAGGDGGRNAMAHDARMTSSNAPVTRGPIDKARHSRVVNTLGTWELPMAGIDFVNSPHDERVLPFELEDEGSTTTNAMARTWPAGNSNHSITSNGRSEKRHMSHRAWGSLDQPQEQPWRERLPQALTDQNFRENELPFWEEALLRAARKRYEGSVSAEEALPFREHVQRVVRSGTARVPRTTTSHSIGLPEEPKEITNSLVRTHLSNSRLAPPKRQQVVRVEANGRRISGASEYQKRKDRLRKWEGHRTRKKAELFEMMANSPLVGPSSANSSVSGLNESAKRRLVEEVDQFFNRR